MKQDGQVKLKKLIDCVNPDVLARLHPTVIPYLEETNEPLYAYCVIAVPKRVHTRVGQDRKAFWTSYPCIVNLEDQPAQKSGINDRVYNRNGKVVCFGNFPTYDDPNKKRREKYSNYNEPGRLNPWDEMKEFLNRFLETEMNMNTEIAGVEAKFQSEIERLKAENEALKKNKGQDKTPEKLPPRDAKKDQDGQAA